MSNKYISQINKQNFVYPNNDIAEYDVDIIHDINNNSVSGTVTNFTATTVTTTGITYSLTYSWAKNNAEVFERTNGNTSIWSLHLMAADQEYYKPWRLINEASIASFTGSTSTATITGQTITPSPLGLTSFTNGTYQFEMRFIGHRSVYPVCFSYTVTGLVPSPTATPTSTPTPTPTMTGATPTPTPTPTPVVSIYTSGATLNVTDTGYIKYTNSSGTTTYFYCSSLGTQVLSDCLDCTTITYGYPFADLANFTVTNCGTSCGGVSTTPTPTAKSGSFGHYIMTDCQTYQTRYTQSIAYGTFNSGDRVEGSEDYFYVITGFTPSSPDPSLIFYVTATGEFGCP